ncbi:MAG: hypothetical protein QHJ81_12955 [Anaerolineae bacterium]|nr:hypothetical protein [Anaerolineae bacterium]
MESRRLSPLWPYLVLALLTLLVGAHLLRSGLWVSGDGLHHLYRLAALTRYLRQGALYPRWIGEFAFGYGVPVFNFYSPLSYYLAQPLAPLGPVWALKLTMLLGLFASGALLYRFALPHVGRVPALAAAAVYICAPYRCVDLYPRAALAEHMAFLWPPLILWACDGLWEGRRRGWQALGWAGLVLTHSFTALMFAPFFALYLGWWAWRRRQARPLAWAVLSLALALGLTAFFWLPLGAEQRYVGLGMPDTTRGYRNHLVGLVNLVGPMLYDYTTGERPGAYFAFGAAPTAVLLASMVALLRRPGKEQEEGRFLPAFGVITSLAALFMAGRLSQPLWDVLAPLLGPLQFPWRFLGMATLGLALGSAGLIQMLAHIGFRVKGAYRFVGQLRAVVLQASVGGIVVALLLAGSLARLPFVPLPLTAAEVTPEHLWAFERETGQAGTTWGGEFLPVGVKEQRWALGRAPEAPRDGPTIPAPTVRLASRAGDGFTLTVENDVPWPFRLHAFYFPGWQVRVDGHPVPTAATGEMGLVTAEVPAGQHVVEVRFEPTGVRLAGRWVSGLSLAALPLAASWPLRGWRRRAIAGGLACLALLATAFIPGLGPRPVRPAPLQALFGDQAELVGAEFPARARPGERLSVQLYWLALRQVGRNDKAFVHLTDAEGRVIAQHDGDPGGGFTPTSRWQPGELVEDRHYVDVPPDLPAGRYRLKAGLYQFEPFRNLLTEPPSADGRVDIGEVVIR